MVLGGAAAFDNLVYPGDGAGGYMPHGPGTTYETTASGLTIGDVTGDGLDDIIEQKVEGGAPQLRLTASTDWATFAPTVSVTPGGLGTELADIDGNGTLDIVTTIDERLFALVARGGGAFEAHDLGIMAKPSCSTLPRRAARRGAPHACTSSTTAPRPARSSGSLSHSVIGQRDEDVLYVIVAVHVLEPGFDLGARLGRE